MADFSCVSVLPKRYDRNIVLIMLAILLGPQYINPTDDEYSSREQGQYHGNWCPGSLLRQFRHIQYLKWNTNRIYCLLFMLLKLKYLLINRTSPWQQMLWLFASISIMVLPIQYKQVLVFHKTGFQLPVPSQWFRFILCFLSKLQLVKG